MLPQKTLWRLARRLTSDSLSADWVSASRDSELNASRFKSWLHSLPVPPDTDCFLIRGAHDAAPMTWADAVSALQLIFPPSDTVYIMTSDFGSALRMEDASVACFQRKSPNPYEKCQGACELSLLLEGYMVGGWGGR